MSRSELFSYVRISRKATVPGLHKSQHRAPPARLSSSNITRSAYLHLWGSFTPPFLCPSGFLPGCGGSSFVLVLHGVFPPRHLRAPCYEAQ